MPRALLPALAVAGLLSLSGCGPNIPKADSLEAQSDALMVAHAYNFAIFQLEKSVKLDPNEPRRWIKLGRAQRAAGLEGPATDSYQHALDLDPANVEALQNLAVLAVHARHFDDAKTFAEPLMQLSSEDIAGLLTLGAIALAEKRFPDALGYCDRMIRAAPTNITGYSLKASVLDGMGRPAEAAALLAQQAALNPDNLDILLQLMQLYQHSHNAQGIRNTAIDLARLVPNDPRYQMEAARAYYARGDRATSDKMISGLLARYRYLPDIALAAAQFWRGTLPPDVAQARILDLAEHSTGRTKAALCDLLIATGQAPIVLIMLAPNEQAQADSGNADLLAVLAKALLVLGHVDRAKTVADRVLAYDAQIDTALIVRAKVYLLRKRFTDALTDAQRAVDDNDQNVDAAVLIPKIFAASGNKVLAASSWGDASSRLPDSVQVLNERIAWLIANQQPEIAEGIAATFARGHAKLPEGWQAYRTACLAAKDDACAEESSRMLDRLSPKARK